ncbi:MAG: hypothetical protein U0324_46170 [Polyangiales bacterium]
MAQLTELGIGEATQPWEWPPRRAPYFLDCGAFTFWKHGKPFDRRAFARAVAAAFVHPIRPDWVVLPDVVADAAATFDLSAEDLPTLACLGFTLAFVVQDGMSPETFPLWDHVAVVFVGGSLRWKLDTAPAWCRAARERGKRCHIGRMGSARRVRWARAIRADSVDSCVPLWSERKLNQWTGALFDPEPQQLQFGWTPPPATQLRAHARHAAT